MYASTKEASTYNGKQYAAPTVYYSWGMFYRKDLFQKAGITGEPKTWPEFLDACKKLKAAGIAPVAVAGPRCVDARGLVRLPRSAHQRQRVPSEADGGRSAVHRRAREEGLYRVEGADRRRAYFIDNSLSYDLDAVQPFLFQGKAAMMLMGTFITAGFPAEHQAADGLLPVPDHRRECADGRRRSGRVAAYSVEGEEQGRRAHVPRFHGNAGDQRAAREGSRLAAGEQPSRRNRKIRFRRSASRSCRRRRAASRSSTIAT